MKNGLYSIHVTLLDGRTGKGSGAPFDNRKRKENPYAPELLLSDVISWLSLPPHQPLHSQRRSIEYSRQTRASHGDSMINRLHLAQLWRVSSEETRRANPSPGVVARPFRARSVERVRPQVPQRWNHR